jgi:hypothetical protein
MTSLLAATNRQVPQDAILHKFGTQTYLGNNYFVSQTFTVGSSEIPLILLQNTQAGNAQTLIGVFNDLLKVVGKTASNSIILNAYLNPTFSAAGTPITIGNYRSSYGNTKAIATLTSVPTVSANGTLIDSISAPALSVSSSDILKILDNGQNLLITGIASAASTSVGVILGWREI